ncbi:MAG: terminase large subunit [Thermoguttaceae bacterium]|jgi:hypothetical protein|nr:terminase large subunit [Thermoguttaceae bacterium]
MGISLPDVIRSPVAFRKALRIDTDAGPRRLATCLDDWQAADFAALDPAWLRVAGRGKGGPARAYLERPRGHSKTSDLAVMAAWVLLASRRQLAGVAAAGDRDQARLLRDAIERLCRLNKWLAAILDVQAFRVINRQTGSVLEILSSDAATSWGTLADFIILDEISVWKTRDLWDSLLSAAAKRSHCMLLIISNAGFGRGESWQWEVRENARTDPRWHFGRLDGPQASWILPEHLDEQKRLLPALVYRRVWLNEWTTGSGDALDPAEIDRAIVLPGPINGPERGWAYVAGVDLATTRDAAAVCLLGVHVGYEVEAEPEYNDSALVRAGILHRALEHPTPDLVEYITGSGRVRLANSLLWRAGADGRRIAIGAVERAILSLHAVFGLDAVAVDPWQGIQLVERLHSQGVPAHVVDFTGPNLKYMATAVLGAFSEGIVELYDDANLVPDLRDLRLEERAYGIRLVSPRNERGHGDAATAFSLSLLYARRIAGSGRSARVDGELVCWP